MNYLDIWFFDNRNRIKVFICYILLFVAFFIFSDFIIYAYTKSMYKPIANYEIDATPAEVIIQTAQASNVNGSIKGTIKNNTEEDIENKYLKFDFYTPRNVNVGTKYIEIGRLYDGNEKDFELGFKYDNVTSVKISMIDKEEFANITPEELEIYPTFGPAGLISTVILGSFLW